MEQSLHRRLHLSRFASRRTELRNFSRQRDGSRGPPGRPVFCTGTYSGSDFAAESGGQPRVPRDAGFAPPVMRRVVVGTTALAAKRKNRMLMMDSIDVLALAIRGHG